MPEELCVEVSNILQEVVTKTIPKKKMQENNNNNKIIKKCKKTKWLSEEALQIAEKRSEK